MGRAEFLALFRRSSDADPAVPASLPERAAEWRWHEHNARAEARGCPCGRPATQSTAYPEVVGTVPYRAHTCDEHVGAVGWSGAAGQPMEPMYSHPAPCPLGDTRGSMGLIDGPTLQYHCPHRVHTEGEGDD